MKPLFIIVFAFLLAVEAYADEEEKPFLANGIVSLEIFPGRPNYESIEGGDEREEAWILTTPDKKRFQLVIIDNPKPKFAILRRNLGKNLTVRGTAWEAHTGHHHTEIMVTVSLLESRIENTAQK